MAPDVNDIEQVLDSPLSVEPSAIEAEFARIWRETASPGSDESSIRLRVVNFVGLARSDAERERFEDVMQALPQRHPCRGILAVAAPDHTGPLAASISAHCWRAGGSRHLCSEEVVLAGGVADEQALASAVLALLVPELPVSLWAIAADDLQGKLLDLLLDAVDRVYVDSQGVRDLETFYRGIGVAHRAHDTAVFDLAWCRLSSWRGLVAQFFDGDSGAGRLSHLNEIEIVSGGNSASSQALLLAGWLISCLGMELADVSTSADVIQATLYDASHGVTVRIVNGDAHELPLNSVRVRTSEADFIVELHSESGHMHVREEWPDAPVHRIVARDPDDDASIFGEALDDTSGSTIFMDALESALALITPSSDE